MNIKGISKEIHQAAMEKGFWDSERNFGELLMLVTSELSEALEADRKGRHANIELLDFDRGDVRYNEEEDYPRLFKMHIKDTVEDEIADAVIRLFDLAEGLGMDLEWHIQHKMQYNKTRERLHGKAY